MRIDFHKIKISKTQELKYWTPWLLNKLQQTGSTALSGCEYVGESLAAFLGITTPKYSYEIEQYKKIMHEQELLAKEDMESAKWLEPKTGNQSNGIAVTNQDQLQKY